MSAMPERIGKYEILSELGRGAMGAVYRARDPVLDRPVALKTMSEALLADPAMRERFYREARAAARLQHPNIVTVFELGDIAARPFIAMELLEGRSLEQAMGDGSLQTVAAKVGVVLQVCQGLDFAHRRGVVHRDIKPGNIHLVPNGTVKILDFGIAIHQDATMMTRTGMVLGTPNYMAPEQISGEGTDHRSDQWAVGVILYELLSGVRPFEAGTLPNLIYRIVHQPSPRLQIEALCLPPGLASVTERALRKDASQRFQDLAEMASTLRRALAAARSAPPAAARTAPADTPARSARDGQGARDGDEVTTAQRPPARLPTAAPRPGSSGVRTTRSLVPYRELATFGERVEAQVVALSPGEELVAIGGVDGGIRLWDLIGRSKLDTLRSSVHLRVGHEGLVTCLAFSGDGRSLASGHVDGRVHVWRVEDGRELEVRLAHDAAVGAMAFSPDCQTLATGSLDATVKLWDMTALQAGEARRQLLRQPAAVTSLTYDGDGKYLITGHANRVVRVHDASTGRLLSTLRGHGAAISALSIARGTDLLISGGRDHSLRLFDLKTRASRAVLEGHRKAIAAVALFPDARRAASVASENRLILWDLERGAAEATLWGEASDSFVALEVLDGGRQIAAGLSDGRIRIWGAA